jgi:hypothetical protein
MRRCDGMARVLDWMPNEEGLAEARREGGNGLGDPLLGTGHLTCVAGDEVVDDLPRGMGVGSHGV